MAVYEQDIEQWVQLEISVTIAHMKWKCTYGRLNQAY